LALAIAALLDRASSGTRQTAKRKTSSCHGMTYLTQVKNARNRPESWPKNGKLSFQWETRRDGSLGIAL
jgi:hypothetical protein